MKLASAFVLFLLFSTQVEAQQIDSRLLSRYSEAEIVKMKSENPEDYKMMLYALDNAIYFADRPKGKEVDLPTISVAGEHPNFIELGLEIADQNQYFLVEGQDRLLVMKSKWVLNYEMNKK